MNALDIELRRRNARLRAWATVGVSIEGTWVRCGSAVVVHLACTLCREGKSARFFGAPAAMASFERMLLDQITHVGCTHLHPLAGDDPEEICARTRWELSRKAV